MGGYDRAPTTNCYCFERHAECSRGSGAGQYHGSPVERHSQSLAAVGPVANPRRGRGAMAAESL